MTTGLYTVALRGLPLPPSVNDAYRNLQNHGRVKTYKHRVFEGACASWAIQNRKAVEAAKALWEQAGPGIGLSAEYVFYFNPERVLMKQDTHPKHGGPKKKKKNESKKLDVSNYVKIVEDQICKAVGHDDAYFWQVKANKDVAAPPGEGERVDVLLSLVAHPVV